MKLSVCIVYCCATVLGTALTDSNSTSSKLVHTTRQYEPGGYTVPLVVKGAGGMVWNGWLGETSRSTTSAPVSASSVAEPAPAESVLQSYRPMVKFI